MSLVKNPTNLVTPRPPFGKSTESCDLLIEELKDRFDQNFLKPLLAMDKVIIKSANVEDCAMEVQEVKDSVMGKDFDFL